MAHANGRHPRDYSVGLTGKASEEILTITEDAKTKGTAHRVDSAFEALLKRLKVDPSIFGEPQYRIPKMSMSIRCAAVAPLYIEYGVHDVQPIVVIRRVVAILDWTS